MSIRPGGPSKADLSGTYAQLKPSVVDFARRSGVDVTGAVASDAALATVLAAASAAAPVCIEFTSGTYRFDTAKTFDPQIVSMRSADGADVVLDFSHVVTGPALTISRPFARMARPVTALAGLRIIGPTDPATTVDGIALGGTGYANGLRFDRVRTTGFRDQWGLLLNCYLNTWHHCSMGGAQRNAVRAENVANANENQLFLFCTLGENLAASVYCEQVGATLHFTSCSFDYSEQDIELRAGLVALTDCYFEAADTATTASTERIVLRATLDSTPPVLKMKGGSVWPFWTAADTTGTFIRITGDTSTIKSNATVDIEGTQFRTDPAATLRYLIIDDRTIYTGSAGDSAVDKFSKVRVNGITYKGSGGAYGQYAPLVYKDVAGREMRLDDGVNYGLVGDARGTSSSWQGSVPEIVESLPRLMAMDRKQFTSGDLYIVALPRTGPGWRASAADILLGLSNGGTSITYARAGYYDGGRNYAPSATLGLVNSGGLVLNSGAESIKTAGMTGTIGFAPNQLIYLALLVTSTGTMPMVYGRQCITALSPLLDPLGTTFPMVVGKLAAQTALPASITVSSLVKVDFVPWLALRPTAYS